MTNGAIITTEGAAWTQDQIDLLKRTFCKGATDDEFALFTYAAKRSGLDPFTRQIHAVKRWDKKANRDVMSIQTGIDGYRVIAQRSGTYAGNEDAEYGPAKGGFPEWARVTVYRIVAGQRCPFTSTARWSEYVQTDRDGAPTFMWRKMPYLMLAKCAEALALRKAFPAELSGLYTNEEMAQAENETEPPRPSVEEPRRKPQPQAAPAPAKAQPPVVDAEVVREPGADEDDVPLVMPDDPQGEDESVLDAANRALDEARTAPTRGEEPRLKGTAKAVPIKPGPAAAVQDTLEVYASIGRVIGPKKDKKGREYWSAIVEDGNGPEGKGRWMNTYHGDIASTAKSFAASREHVTVRYTDNNGYLTLIEMRSGL